MTAARKVDFDNANRDLDHVAAIATSRQNTATDRTGQVTPTLYAQLMKVGVLPPVAYASGIVFGSEDITKSIERSGVVYVPLPSALPFTTSGTWTGSDDAKFRVTQGVTSDQLALPVAAAGIGSVPGSAPFNFTQIQQALTQFNARLSKVAHITDPQFIGMSTINAINSALAAYTEVVIPPNSGGYTITSPIVINNGNVLRLEGATVISTVPGIIRFPAGGISTIYAARAVLQTNAATAGSAIAIEDGAEQTTQPFIFGFPRVLSLNSFASDTHRGIDFTGFYGGYFEIEASGFYAPIYGYGDGDGSGPLTTYYNTFHRPKLNPGPQGYAGLIYNLCNGTIIDNPFVNGGSTAYGGFYFADSDACGVYGGYIEGFAANSGSVGLVLENSDGFTGGGFTLDQSGDSTASVALKLVGTTTGADIQNVSFAGDWNQNGRKLLNTASGDNRISSGPQTLDYFGGVAGEGNWTPNQGAGLTVVGAFSSRGKYQRVGNRVTVTGQLNGATSIACSAGGILCSNLPFSSPGDGSGDGQGTRHNIALGDFGGVYVNVSSVYSIGAASATTRIYFQATYFVLT